MPTNSADESLLVELAGQSSKPFLVAVDESLHDSDVGGTLVLHVDHLTLPVSDSDRDYAHYCPVVAGFVAKDQGNIATFNLI